MLGYKDDFITSSSVSESRQIIRGTLKEEFVECLMKEDHLRNYGQQLGRKR